MNPLQDELRQIEQALALIERRFPDYQFVKLEERSEPLVLTPSSPMRKRTAPQGNASESLPQAIQRVMLAHPEKEWTTAEVYDSLEAIGYPLPAPKAQRMANISTSLGKMVARPSPPVALISKGAGRYNPNRYQAVTQASEAV